MGMVAMGAATTMATAREVTVAMDMEEVGMVVTDVAMAEAVTAAMDMEVMDVVATADTVVGMVDTKTVAEAVTAGIVAAMATVTDRP